MGTTSSQKTKLKTFDDVEALCKDPSRKTGWALYWSPADFPGKWVARLFILDVGEEPYATSWALTAEERIEVEQAIPLMARNRWTFFPEINNPENPQIVGTFL